MSEGKEEEVHTSKKTTRLLPMNAIAKHSFRFWPPDSAPALYVCVSTL